MHSNAMSQVRCGNDKRINYFYERSLLCQVEMEQALLEWAQ